VTNAISRKSFLGCFSADDASNNKETRDKERCGRLFERVKEKEK
jgi:hypothetical protein